MSTLILSKALKTVRIERNERKFSLPGIFFPFFIALPTSVLTISAIRSMKSFASNPFSRWAPEASRPFNFSPWNLVSESFRSRYMPRASSIVIFMSDNSTWKPAYLRTLFSSTSLNKMRSEALGCSSTLASPSLMLENVLRSLCSSSVKAEPFSYLV